MRDEDEDEGSRHRTGVVRGRMRSLKFIGSHAWDCESTHTLKLPKHEMYEESIAGWARQTRSFDGSTSPARACTNSTKSEYLQYLCRGLLPQRHEKIECWNPAGRNVINRIVARIGRLHV